MIIQICKTLGIEFETDFINPVQINPPPGWYNTHDASIENYAMRLPGGLTILNNEPLDYLVRVPHENIIIGTEYVSPILDGDADSLFSELNYLLKQIYEAGDPIDSKRSGIHIHVSMPHPSVGILRTILRLGRKFEKLFFRIGGLGREFRGIYNDSTYCRPITGFGPPVVPGRGESFYQCFNLEDLLITEKESILNFWDKFCDLNRKGDTRYTPCRYVWLNIFPMYPGSEYRGTLEFRQFNKTFNPEFLYAIIKLCRAFCKASVGLNFLKSKELGLLNTENSILNDGKPKEKDLYLLDEFAEIADLDSEIKKVLVAIINCTPEFLLENSMIYSHLMYTRSNLGTFFYGNDSGYRPTKVNLSLVKKPNYIDIHNIRD